MDYTLREICTITGGTLVGDGNTRITGVASLEGAGPGDITFVKGEEFVEKALKTRASAMVVHREIKEFKSAPSLRSRAGLGGQIVVKDPFLAFVKILEVFSQERGKRHRGIHPPTLVAKTATIGREVSIGAYSVIEEGAVIGDRATIYPMVYIGHNTKIGEDTLIYPMVSIREEVSIGKRVIIHSGTAIGGDGFGYLQVEGRHVKIPQVGTIEIGDDVEIGCNVTIARATLDKTVIARGVKIDNHSHIAHNVVIGEDTMLIAYAKIAGGAVIGKNVMIAEDVGITDHATIGDGCVIGGGSNVYKSLPPGSVVWGSPAKPIMEEKRLQVLFRKLPNMWETLKRFSNLLKQKAE
ncbi:MAG: UDP-3-O-(3-hydroxymyristoyl)glucosamine N-acyltransferase [Planctomycetes bacterium RIFCSPHIGHO2_12_FULL_52_36]|nr:MAG: UDP-3-O-(3-hydroxymyristoyl)glucosamine N-acyltransferase [Planctomycetes bacterium RIFCSPHIGHO2_02_FULL_52_58]OHB93532.1 MAG: UDP-3-O-(3-hydroxymyristoyl)glucosamine N-acyltransferase [Planctomycetes bacterium RIFCSPHIGHO2_12_FULL_52_36]